MTLWYLLYRTAIFRMYNNSYNNNYMHQVLYILSQTSGVVNMHAVHIIIPPLKVPATCMVVISSLAVMMKQCRFCSEWRWGNSGSLIITEGKVLWLFLFSLLTVSDEFLQSLWWFPGPYTILHSFWPLLGPRNIHITFKVSRLNFMWSCWLKNPKKNQ